MKQSTRIVLGLCLLLSLAIAYGVQADYALATDGRMGYRISDLSVVDATFSQGGPRATTVYLPCVAHQADQVLSTLPRFVGSTLLRLGREYISYFARDVRFACFYGFLMVGLVLLLAIQWVKSTKAERAY